MKKIDLKFLSTIILILLCTILGWTLIGYLSTSPIDTADPSLPVINTPKIDSVISGESGEKITDAIIDIDDKPNATSGENVADEPSKRPVKNENPVIITSDSTMTNQEKKEILSDLDRTLMELLEVVDKVQPVDETRLVTEESEVQE